MHLYWWLCVWAVHTWLEACWCYAAGFFVGDVVSECRLFQSALWYHITNSQSRYITPTRLKSPQYSLHNNTTSSRKLLKMDVLTSETCWAVNWHSKASVIKLVYLYSKFYLTYFPTKRKNKQTRSPTTAWARAKVRKSRLNFWNSRPIFRLTNIMPLPQSGTFPLDKNALFTNSTTYLDGEARLNCVNWYLHWANAWKIDSTRVVFSREVCFISVDTGNQRIPEIPLHAIKFHAWCPMSTTRTNGATIFLRPLLHSNMSRVLWHQFLYTCPITRKLITFLSPATECNSWNYRQLCALFRLYLC